MGAQMATQGKVPKWHMRCFSTSMYLQQVAGDIGETTDVSAGHGTLELAQLGLAVDQLAGSWPQKWIHGDLNDEGSAPAGGNKQTRAASTTNTRQKNGNAAGGCGFNKPITAVEGQFLMHCS